MNKEKQIEEMAILARVFCQTIKDGGSCEKCAKCGTYRMAERLYNAGYRKETQGKWVYREDHGAYDSPYFCSNCLADCGSDIDGEHYCYSCGARMINAKYRKPR